MSRDDWADEDFIYDEDAMDLWRLHDTLSVVDAAMLTVGINPGRNEPVYPSYPNQKFHIRGESNSIKNYFNSSRFLAVFEAIRRAVLSNRIRANITHLGRAEGYVYCASEIAPAPPETHEENLEYSLLLRSPNVNIQSNADFYSVWGNREAIHIVKEPDWSKTDIEVEDLKAWMQSKGFTNNFFFSQGKLEGFRDKNHPRYVPKLAACVAAWEAIDKKAKNRTVKRAIEEWLRSNGVNYGIGNEGIVSESMAKTLAEIANWDPNGGAPSTGGQPDEPAEKPKEPINNYPFEHGKNKDDAAIGSDDLDDVPF